MSGTFLRGKKKYAYACLRGKRNLSLGRREVRRMGKRSKERELWFTSFERR
jgi:hypothetical protein